MTQTKIDLRTTGLLMHRAHANPHRQFQVLGERASGTNVVRKTISQNVKIKRVDSLGWKHGFPHMVAVPNNLIVICVVRNAWNWALSMHKRPWHADPEIQKLGFSDFVRSEWRSIVDRPTDFDFLHEELKTTGTPLQYDRHPITGLPFPNLFALRQAKLQALVGIANRECSYVFVTLESFNKDPLHFVTTLCDTFDLVRRPREFRTVERRMGNLHNRAVKTVPKSSDDEFHRDFVFMIDTLDIDLETRLGYQYT